MKNNALVNKMVNCDQEAGIFSYHKQSGYIGFIGAMIFVVLLESIGVSFFLAKWSPLLHWLHLVFCLLVILFLIMDVWAVVKNPIIVNNGMLLLKVGLRPRVGLELTNIKELKDGSINYEKDRKAKEVLDLSLLGLDQPTFEIVLLEPISCKNFFGKEVGPYTRIFFSVDDKVGFSRMIDLKIIKNCSNQGG